MVDKCQPPPPTLSCLILNTSLYTKKEHIYHNMHNRTKYSFASRKLLPSLPGSDQIRGRNEMFLRVKLKVYRDRKTPCWYRSLLTHYRLVTSRLGGGVSSSRDKSDDNLTDYFTWSRDRGYRRLKMYWGVDGLVWVLSTNMPSLYTLCSIPCIFKLLEVAP